MRVDLGVGEIGPVGPVGPEGPQGPPGLGFDVVAKTTSYTVVPGDSGNLLTFNGANKTATLPAAAPAEPWAISILNLNATALTVTPNGLTLNGSGASITLQQGQGVFIWSDGSNYLVGGALPASVDTTQWTAAKTGAYVIQGSDKFVVGDATAGGFTLTLPSAVSYVGLLVVKAIHNNANDLSVAASGGQTIDGGQGVQTLSTVHLGPQRAWSVIGLTPDGTNWRVVFGVPVPRIMDLIRDGGVVTNSATDQAAKINAWLVAVTKGHRALVPGGNGATFINSAIELVDSLPIEGVMPGSGLSEFRAMTGFPDDQMLRTWKSTDGTVAFNPPATDASDVNYPRVKSVELDANGNSGITLLALLHPGEKARIEDVFFVDGAGSPGTGKVGLAIFSNSTHEAAGRFPIDHLVGYHTGWKNLIFIDGTNNGELTSTSPTWGARDIELTRVTTPIGPPDGSTFSDSPFYIKAAPFFRLSGHQEGKPPNTVDDTAFVRLIDCRDALIYDHLFHMGGYAVTRPLVRSTATGTTGSPTTPAFATPNSPHLRNCPIEWTGGTDGYLSRDDAGCVITHNSTTIADTAITANDLYRKPTGPFVQSNTKITGVTPGTSFTVDKAPQLPAGSGTATVTLTITQDVIQDETPDGRVRRFRSHARFKPSRIIEYTGESIRWMDSLTSPTEKFMASLVGDRRVASPDAIVASSVPFGRHWAGGWTSGAFKVPTSGTSMLTPIPYFPGDVTAHLTFGVQNTSAVGVTHSFMFLLDPDLRLVAWSADAGSANVLTSSHQYTYDMLTPYTADLPAYYYAGIVIVASTMPGIVATANNSALDTNFANNVWPGDSTAGLSVPTDLPAAGVLATPSKTQGWPIIIAT